MHMIHFAFGVGTLWKEVSWDTVRIVDRFLGGQRGALDMEILRQVKIYLNLPSTKPGYACWHSIIINIALFHSQKCCNWMIDYMQSYL